MIPSMSIFNNCDDIKVIAIIKEKYTVPLEQ